MTDRNGHTAAWHLLNGSTSVIRPFRPLPRSSDAFHDSGFEALNAQSPLNMRRAAVLAWFHWLQDKTRRSRPVYQQKKEKRKDKQLIHPQPSSSKRPRHAQTKPIPPRVPPHHWNSSQFPTPSPLTFFRAPASPPLPEHPLGGTRERRAYRVQAHARYEA